MRDLYNFVSGPMVWIAFAVFFFGCLYRLIRMFSLVNRKEKFIFSYMSLKYSLRSILHWSVPFAAENMRRHPVMTIVTFAFHFCLLITPLFLIAHVVLWDEAWHFSWGHLPERLADIMTLVVICGCLFFLVRRLILPEVQFVTSASDYIILGIVAMPFITGFMAYHQWFNYPFFMVLHILSGEIMLMTIPFTRLAHMIFAPFTRAYMGSEFGGIRHARDW